MFFVSCMDQSTGQVVAHTTPRGGVYIGITLNERTPCQKSWTKTPEEQVSGPNICRTLFMDNVARCSGRNQKMFMINTKHGLERRESSTHRK